MLKFKEISFPNEYNLFVSHGCIDEFNIKFIQELISLFQNVHLNVLTSIDINPNFITESRLVLFILTNDYFKTEKFKQEHKYARLMKKRLIFVLLEKINNFDEHFNVINLSNRIINSELLNDEQLNKLWCFINTIYGVNLKQDEHKCISSNIQNKFLSNDYFISIDANFFLKSYYDEEIFNKIRHIASYASQYTEYLSASNSKTLNTFYLHSGSCYVRKINYLSHLDYLCVAYNVYKQITPDMYMALIDLLNFKVVKNVQVNDHRYSFYIESKHCIYTFNNESNNLTVSVYNDNIELIRSFSIKTINTVNNVYEIDKMIYICYSKTEVIDVYDLDMNYKKSITDKSLYEKFKKSCDYHHLILYHSEIDRNFGTLRSQNPNLLPRNKSYYFTFHDNFTFIFEYNSLNGNVEAKGMSHGFTDKSLNFDLTCQYNRYYLHSMKIPYLLPCNKYACLKCICENYDFISNTLKCKYCGNEHKYEINRKNFMNESFNQHIKEIASVLVTYKKKLISSLG